jgi:DNA-binding XRE family transcriptional regulator
MAKVELNLPSEIEGACGQIETLVLSGLSDSLKRNLKLVLRAARSWDSHLNRSAVKTAAEDIPTLITQAREEKRLSHYQLARLVGTTPQTIYKIENGQTKHSSFLGRIAGELEIPLERMVRAGGQAYGSRIER